MKPFSLVACCACTLSAPVFAADLPAPASSPPALQSGIEKQYFDPKVRAADDFYTYVNGAWLQATPIPPDKASYGVWTILSDATRKHTNYNLQAANLVFSLSNCPSLERKAWQAALTDAATRAQALARLSGVRLGKILDSGPKPRG